MDLRRRSIVARLGLVDSISGCVLRGIYADKMGHINMPHLDSSRNNRQDTPVKVSTT